MSVQYTQLGTNFLKRRGRRFGGGGKGGMGRSAFRIPREGRIFITAVGTWAFVGSSIVRVPKKTFQFNGTTLKGTPRQTSGPEQPGNAWAYDGSSIRNVPKPNAWGFNGSTLTSIPEA